MQQIQLEVPGHPTPIRPGVVIKINRFDTVCWRVEYGWYSWGSNRPVCGWYLMNTEDCKEIKPLFQTDLLDIYFIEF